MIITLQVILFALCFTHALAFTVLDEDDGHLFFVGGCQGPSIFIVSVFLGVANLFTCLAYVWKYTTSCNNLMLITALFFQIVAAFRFAHVRKLEFFSALHIVLGFLAFAVY